MVNFFVDNFGNSVVLAVLIMAMIPTLESKVAIPFGLSVAIWGEQVLSPLAAFCVALLGSLLPAILVVWLTKLIKNKTSGFVHEKIWTRLEGKFRPRMEKVDAKQSTFKKCAWVAFFVAVPLPLTGVYSGGVIAALLGLKTWQAFVSLAIGDAISCAIVLVLCLLFANSTFYIFIVALAMIAIWLLGCAIVSLFKRFRRKKNS